MTWGDCPLAVALRDCIEFVTKGGALETQARFALEWAEREDAEIDRISREVLAEARAEVEQESAEHEELERLRLVVVTHEQQRQD